MTSTDGRSSEDFLLDETSTWRRARQWRPRREVPTADARASVRGVVLIQLLANGIGLLIVVVFLRLLFPLDLRTGESAQRLNVTVFTVYILVNGLIALPINGLMVRRALSWVRRDEPPTEHQRNATLSLSIVETLSAFVTWVVGAAIFGVLFPDAQRIAIGIGLAGLVVCAHIYLQLEVHLRPVVAAAIADAELPDRRSEILARIMLAWLVGSAVPLLAVGLAPTLLPTVAIDRTKLGILLLVAIVAGGGAMFIAARSVSAPLDRVRNTLLEVAKGNLDVVLPVDNLGEIGRLSEGVNELVDAMRERDELAVQFERQVGLPAAEALGTQHGDGDERELTTMFCDLTGYTAFSESHKAGEVVDLLNRFFEIAVRITDAHGGWVNKFEGDAILAVFGAPQPNADHARSALDAASELLTTLEAADDLLPVGIGVATGRALAVNVGSAHRFEYTVIGDVVNLASRLCDLAKTTEPSILTTVDTLQAAGDPPGWTASGPMRIRGRSRPVMLAHPVRA